MAASRRIYKNSWNQRTGHSAAWELLVNSISSFFLVCGFCFVLTADRKEMPNKPPSTTAYFNLPKSGGANSIVQKVEFNIILITPPSMITLLYIKLYNLQRTFIYIFSFDFLLLTSTYHVTYILMDDLTYLAQRPLLSLLFYRWVLARQRNSSRITQPVKGGWHWKPGSISLQRLFF